MASFTKDMSILEALEINPKAQAVFQEYGMGCAGCMGAMMESIENGAKMHGLDPDRILEELNKLGPADKSDEE